MSVSDVRLPREARPLNWERGGARVLWVSDGELRELVEVIAGAACVPVVLRSDGGGELRVLLRMAEG